MRSPLAAVPCKGRLLARGKRLYGLWGGVDGLGHGATLSMGRLGRGLGARCRAPCPSIERIRVVAMPGIAAAIPPLFRLAVFLFPLNIAGAR